MSNYTLSKTGSEIDDILERADKLPTLSSSDNGKTLQVDSNGDIVANTVSGGMSNPMTTSQDIIVGGSSGTPSRLAKGNNNELLGVNGSGNLAYTKSLPYLTTAPSSANTSGGIILVVLDSEPSTYYEGYYYIITEPSGYSGNIASSLASMSYPFVTYVKFDTAPTSASDYDFLGGTTTNATYSNKTKIYIWGEDTTRSGVNINGVETYIGVNATTYSNALEIALTGDYAINVFYGVGSQGGGGN